MSDIKFVMRDVDSLIPYARNARTHSPEQVAKIAGSIKEFGFLSPVIISKDGGIIAGHGRVMAAQKLGIKKIPCVEESHLSETQKRAYILADNRLALDAGWDDDMLKLELEDLKEKDFDLDLIGFADEQINNFLSLDSILDDECNGEGGEEQVDIDEETESITEDGNIWILGEHRLICGDSTKKDVVEKLFSGAKPNLMVTDPPYGVKYDGHRNSKCLAVELNPRYCDAIVRRWEKETGGSAILENGVRFDDLELQRFGCHLNF